jgi:hypothetical protein
MSEELLLGVLLVEEELDGVCEDVEELLLISEELLLGVLLVEDCDCEDCEPHLELSDEVLEGEVADEEVLDCGLLLEVESGVEVLPVAPVVLCALELLPTLLLEPVCELLLAEVSGVEDCDELGLLELEPVCASAVISLCGGFEVLFGLFEVELAPFGEEVVELELEEELPEMLPAVFWSELDGVAAAAPAPAAEATVRSLSSTFLTPETDLASFLASFLSSLLATLPLNFAVPLLTEICTP